MDGEGGREGGRPFVKGDGDSAAGAAFKMSSIFHLLGLKIGGARRRLRRAGVSRDGRGRSQDVLVDL